MKKEYCAINFEYPFYQKIRKVPKLVLYYFRRSLWKLLGLPWNIIHKMAQRNYLTTVDWVSIGTRTYDNGSLVWRWSQNETLQIGKYCSIAFGVQFLCGGGHHNFDSVTTYPLVRHLFNRDELIEINNIRKNRNYWDDEFAISKGPIIVENDVWIGQNAIILPGVMIGTGSAVLAGSVVTKDVEPYSIVGGVPAKFIKYRFDKEICEKLLQISWWNWPESLIRERISDFYNINQFVTKYQL